jgi:hypothetical protein
MSYTYSTKTRGWTQVLAEEVSYFHTKSSILLRLAKLLYINTDVFSFKNMNKLFHIKNDIDWIMHKKRLSCITHTPPKHGGELRCSQRRVPASYKTPAVLLICRQIRYTITWNKTEQYILNCFLTAKDACAQRTTDNLWKHYHCLSLICLICLCLRIMVSNNIVLCFCFVGLRLVYPMLPVSITWNKTEQYILNCFLTAKDACAQRTTDNLWKHYHCLRTRTFQKY